MLLDNKIYLDDIEDKKELKLAITSMLERDGLNADKFFEIFDIGIQSNLEIAKKSYNDTMREIVDTWNRRTFRKYIPCKIMCCV